MLHRHAIVRAVVPALAAAALVTSGASAMPRRDGSPPAPSTQQSVLSPDLVDAAAHAATIRGIGAALIARAD
jgi:hypothetical protein